MRRPPQNSIAAALAVWMAAIATGTALTHAHEGGGERHAHGLGIFLRSAPPGHAADPDGGGLHRHFVFFGVEFPGGAAPPGADAPLFDSVAFGAETAFDSTAGTIPAGDDFALHAAAPRASQFDGAPRDQDTHPAFQSRVARPSRMLVLRL